MSRYIGQDIGGYRVIEAIGAGGMAQVFKAYQPSFDRFVALKILPEQYAQDATYIERFKQEARLIARLEHRHILPVYDFGEQHGVTYLAMRYLRGGTLKDLLLQAPGHRLSLADTVKVIRQIAEALDYAHGAGIVHRDVKPANVLIDNAGDAYLMDFGIAKVLESTGHLTATGGAMGTPAYMSPEQGMGKPVDHRADVYALGIILYQLLTGRVPFEADTPYAVIIAHANEPLTLPSTFNAAIPEDIEKVIFKALAKSPDDRYPSAGSLALALDSAAGQLAADINEDAESIDALGADLAQSKPTDEVTRDVRLAAKKKPRQAGAISPLWLGLGGLIFVGLIAALGWAISYASDPARAAAMVDSVTQTAKSDAHLTTTARIGTQQSVRNMTATVRALTPTATAPLPAGEAFAAPILAAIADRPPDIEDDFSTSSNGWRHYKSYSTIRDGVLKISVPDGDFGSSGLPHPQMWAADFVLQVDVRGDTMIRDAAFNIYMREAYSPGPVYNLEFYPQSRGGWQMNEWGDDLDHSGAGGNIPDLLVIGQWSKILVIARGDEFSVFVNDTFIGYFRDDTIPEGAIGFQVFGQGEENTEVEFDNLKFWNLANVPGLP
jgi:serine/threonine protein kinase